MTARLAALGRLFRRELTVYRRVARHPETPALSRWLLAAAAGYLAMPFDLIPDFLPVVGHLDDVLIVPGLVAAALWLVPRHVVAACRADVTDAQAQT